MFWQWHIGPLVHQIIGMLAIHPTSSVVPVTLSKRPFALSILMAFPAIRFCILWLLIIAGRIWFWSCQESNVEMLRLVRRFSNKKLHLASGNDCYIAIENMAQSKFFIYPWKSHGGSFSSYVTVITRPGSDGIPQLAIPGNQDKSPLVTNTAAWVL